ncbi:ABC transporter ATP-binding protein [Aureimonas frigidaquae]|uniref:Oligopeptide ABC transporter, ATP-binding protein n=1 Tax=Aureimonas frigidaquae TaxID=424757 RepID=A0A0P0Z444_9HYPH|nr:oligopeptide/dipeptide ABC transporter ATP-binding protein [Aureimonas frigidaquae]BAT28571.1 oligopeptide ABC transporter, ATP-binding protein [Aureimonas frigidaquae]
MQHPDAARSSAPIVAANGLSMHFAERTRFLGRVKGNPLRAVDGVSFHLERGRCFAVVGESGSGKSTLARMLVGLLRPTAGDVELAGTRLSTVDEAGLRAMRRRVQLVLQDPRASLDPRMRIGAVLEEALIVHGLGRSRQERQDRIMRALRQVGLDAQHLDRFANELSGGQRQRVAIARAIIVEPEILVLDEPVSALDVSVQAQVVNLLMDLQEQLGLTYVIITHDLALVSHMADSVGVMYLGAFVESGPVSAVVAAPRHPYTKSLLSVVATSDPRIERDKPITILEGQIPSPRNMPSGCTFHTRCPLARQIAAQEGGQTAVPAPCATQKPEPRLVQGRTLTCHYAERLG